MFLIDFTRVFHFRFAFRIMREWILLTELKNSLAQLGKKTFLTWNTRNRDLVCRLNMPASPSHVYC